MHGSTAQYACGSTITVCCLHCSPTTSDEAAARLLGKQPVKAQKKLSIRGGRSMPQLAQSSDRRLAARAQHGRHGVEPPLSLEVFQQTLHQLIVCNQPDAIHQLLVQEWVRKSEHVKTPASYLNQSDPSDHDDFVSGARVRVECTARCGSTFPLLAQRIRGITCAIHKQARPHARRLPYDAEV